MNVAQVKQTARAWIEETRPSWPGFLAAHLVGGITQMPDTAPLPPSRDVDIHLIFTDDSPMLRPATGYPLIEVAFDGILIEAGCKARAEYVDAAAVLANPEIAYHLTRDVVLTDPGGLLAALMPQVRTGYADPAWVRARLEHERAGVERALGFRRMVQAMGSAAAEWTILGYAATFFPAALQVATLSPPRLGGRALVHLHDLLNPLDRLDLHARTLSLLGLASMTVADAWAMRERALGAFDLAVAVRRTPHHFEHKIQAHLRPYLADSVEEMIADGYPREATGWAGAYYAACTDVILADAPDESKPPYTADQAAFLRAVGMATPPNRDARYAEATTLRDEIFALADELANRGSPR